MDPANEKLILKALTKIIDVLEQMRDELPFPSMSRNIDMPKRPIASPRTRITSAPVQTVLVKQEDGYYTAVFDHKIEAYVIDPSSGPQELP